MSQTPARKFFKRVAFGVCLILVSPLILAAWIEKQVCESQVVFVGLNQFLSLVPGLVGIYLRGAYYFGTLDNCSWQVHVGFGSLFTHRGASLGTFVSMGAYCVIGHASIGDRVMMASRISIPSGRRQHVDESGRLSSAPRFEKVEIGTGTWIGEGAIVMANVGEHSIVSAGAVVLDDIPPARLVAGNPATAVRILNSEGTGRLEAV
jgi:acetyltransferase-like isoleucine patch superfamily enzyme